MTEVKPVIKFQIRDPFFSPKDTFMSGQFFRFRRGGDKWLVCAGEEVAYIIPMGEGGYEVYCSNEKYIRNFLGLDFNYAQIRTLLSINPFMNEVLAFGKGVNMLRQGSFETLITQLVYIGMERTQAEDTVEKLCQQYGRACEFSGQKYFSFPTPEELGRASEEELLELGLDKRAGVIAYLCRQLNAGELSLDFAEHSDRWTRRYLTRIPGLYGRVIPRTLIFGCQKYSHFVTDAWMKSVFEQHFSTEPGTTKNVEKYFTGTLGNLAGFAYLYLLNYKRNHDLLE